MISFTLEEISIILTWVSTIIFLFGAYLYTGRKGERPKRRIQGYLFYFIGGIFYIIWAFMEVKTYPYAFSQIVFNLLTIRGIYNCLKEIKYGRKSEL